MRRSGKTDEFYTPLDVIEEELVHYQGFLEGKVVYCNCDDWSKSNFVKYFLDNFSTIGLKRLVSTCYYGSDESSAGHGKWMRFDGTTLSEGFLEGDGDFRSEECLRILEECDMVVTNPPFSIFRDLLSALNSVQKDFLILGPISSVASTVAIDMLTRGKLFLGRCLHSGGVKFEVPEHYELKAEVCGIDNDGRRFIEVKGIRWFTSVAELSHGPPPLDLTAKWDARTSRSFDFAPCVLNIDKVKDIPCDYYGWMGVPVTFLDKWNKEQFQVADCISQRFFLDPLHLNDPMTEKARNSFATRVDGKNRYVRLLIRRRTTI